jgi:hypothetical protein
MKYLKLYENFLLENLQQADNYVAKNNLEPFYYNQLKDYVREKGKLGLLYILTLILYNSEDQKNELNQIIDYLDKVVRYGIKIDTTTLTKEPEQFYNQVDKQLYVTDVNKFIDEFAPGFLKKDLKSKYLDEIGRINFRSINKDALRGKMSIFNKPEEWVKYIKRAANKDNLEKLKIADDVKILYENEEWIIFKPESFEAMNYINYPDWCTIFPRLYDKYIDKGYYFIILHNKLNKKLSYIIQAFPAKDDVAYQNVPDDMTDYFTMHPYNGKAVYLSWEPRTGYSGFDVNKIKTGILKIFFDKFVRNGKIVL